MLRFTVLRDMLTVSLWVSYYSGRWKCWEVALHAGISHRMWMGFCILMNLGASSGQMRVIPVSTADGAEISIHIFGAIDVWMLILFTYLIWNEHLISMLASFLAYIAVMHDGGLAWGWRGALILQNCLIAFLHVLNCCSEISTAFVLPCVMLMYLVFMF